MGARGPSKETSDEELMALLAAHGPQGAANMTGISVRWIHSRRRQIELRLGRSIPIADTRGQRATYDPSNFPHRIPLDIKDGIVLIASDCHYWPDIVTTAHRGFVWACKHFAQRKELRAVVLNGDVLDGAKISRFPPTGRQHQPDLKDEIEAVKDRLHEIEMAAGKVKRIWTLGNHDARFENKLADLAPEYAEMEGFRLKDHFANWEPAWAVWINDSVVIKHRWKGGMYAPRNNTVFAGKTMVTGHLHSLKVWPHTDYSGTRWGVDSGTLAEPTGPMFVDYTEDAPLDWRSGFVSLKFKGGRLLTPQIAQKHDDDHIEFLGDLVKV